MENIIWNNELIKIDGKSIYYHNYVKAGILLTNQMQFNKGSLESYNINNNNNNSNNNNNNNYNLFTYNAQVSIYIFTCAELNSLKEKKKKLMSSI